MRGTERVGGGSDREVVCVGGSGKHWVKVGSYTKCLQIFNTDCNSAVQSTIRGLAME